MFQKLLVCCALLFSGWLPAAVVVEPQNLTTMESGSSVQFRVYLDSTPSVGETVTITHNSSDVTEGSVSVASSIFTEANFDEPQYITLTPGSDGINDGDVQYQIDNNVSSNIAGGNYDGVTAGSVTVTNNNIDGIDVVAVNPSSGFFIAEGDAQTINISYLGFPFGDITINLSTLSTEISLSTTSVVLTAANGYSVDFSVTAVDDALVDGDLPFSIETNLDIPNLRGVFLGNPPDINGFVLDNDAALYNVGGTVSGLAVANSITLQNNGMDDLVVNSNTNFAFTTQLTDGSSYDVSVLTQPIGQSCTVNNGNGNVNGADVNDVQVVCVDQSILVDTNSLDFGTISVGSSQSAFVTVTNNGAVDVILTGATSPASPFSIIGGTCLPFSTVLSPTASCAIEVSFAPGAENTFNASFEIQSSATSSPDIISLVGASFVQAGGTVQPVPVMNIWGLVVFVALILMLVMFSYKRDLIRW